MSMPSELPIALFDSGVGGLTVFAALSRLLPEENLLYLGDTARVPYGTRSRETIVRYTLMAAGELARRGVKMLVVACNTATSAALPALKEKFAPLPVIGVVEPGAEAAAAASRSGHIAVIATEATINGHAYQDAIGRILPGARVIGKACTLFVPLAEEGWVSGEVAEGVARRYLQDIFSGEPQNQPDTLLLGCTHFPAFRPVLQKIAGPDVRIVDSAKAAARKVKSNLEALGQLRMGQVPAAHHFLITDNPARFGRAGIFFLGHEIAPDQIEVIDL